MTTQHTTNSETSAEKIAGILRNAQQEIEELVLQFSLGKAEAADKFEEIKKEFRTKTTEWKNTWTSKEASIKTTLDELQVQLSLGKAESKEIFEIQHKKLIALISSLEPEIKQNPELNKYLDEFLAESKKMNLKLHILKLKYELHVFSIKDNFRNEMNDIRNLADKLIKQAHEKVESEKTKFSGFSKEMEQAFSHIKKAITKL